MAKDVAPPPQFPWDQLKAESMRSICRDLGFKQNNNRSVMTHFLESVSKVGLPRALDGAPASAAAAAARTSKKRTRASANEDVATTRRASAVAASISAVTSTGRRTRGRVTRAGQKPEEEADEEEEEEEEEEEREEGSSPSKRSRISVVSNYNTRFRAARRGIVSDPGPGQRRRMKRVMVLRGGEPVSVSAVVGRRGRVRARARARSGGRQARRGARTARGRVRIEEQPVSSESEEGGEEETVSAALVGRAKRAINVRKRTVRVNGVAASGAEEEEEEKKEPRAAKRARRERKVSTAARKRSGRSRSKAGQKMVIDGIDVPPVSRAVSVAMKRKELALGDEDADGEEEEEHFEKAGEVPVVAGSESVEAEGMEDEGVPKEDQDQMPIDEGGPQEEEEDEGYQPIPEDISSPGNSNKENEAPEGEQEEMDTIGAATTATAGTATDMEVEDEMMTQAGAAAAVLFGAGALATAALVLGSPSTNGDEGAGGAQGNDNTAAGGNNNSVPGDLGSF